MKTKKQRNNHKLQKKKKHKTPRKQIKMKMKMKGGDNEAKLDTRTTTNHTEYKSNFYAMPSSNDTETETEPYGFNIIQRRNKKDSIFDINGVESFLRVMEELSTNTNAIIQPKYTETYTIKEKADASPLYPKQQNP